jgi:predicted DNA-binding transcriptional regulator YafY
MKDKFCAFERRTKMLFYITQVKFATRLELAEEFNVSLATINRDILILSSMAPIYTKQGNGGGIYILPEFRSYKNYLTDTEENFLYEMMLKVSNEEKRILCGIITKFTKNPMHEHGSFQNQNEKEEVDEGGI